MQLTIRHTANGLTLPLANHSILQGIIYNCLRNAPSFSKHLHNVGYESEGRNYKLFTFSDIKGKYKVKNRTISYLDVVEWKISSIDPFMILSIKDSIEENGLSYGKQHFDNVTLITSNDTVEDSIVYIQMESPIVAYYTDENRKTIYFNPDQIEFYYSIFNNFKRKYESCFQEEVIDNIEMAKVDVREQDKVVTSFKGLIIEGYLGTYALKGPRKYLDFLLQTGLGAKNSQGFGMFKVLE